MVVDLVPVDLSSPPKVSRVHTYCMCRCVRVCRATVNTIGWFLYGLWPSQRGSLQIVAQRETQNQHRDSSDLQDSTDSHCNTQTCFLILPQPHNLKQELICHTSPRRHIVTHTQCTRTHAHIGRHACAGVMAATSVL